MNSIRIVTLSHEGEVSEFSYECHTSEVALAIIQGTMQGCVNTGWTIKEMEIV